MKNENAEKSLTSFVKYIIENDSVDNQRDFIANESLIEHTAHQFCAAESARLVLPSRTTKRGSSFKAETYSLVAVGFSSK